MLPPYISLPHNKHKQRPHNKQISQHFALYDALYNIIRVRNESFHHKISTLQGFHRYCYACRNKRPLETLEHRQGRV